MINMLYTAWKYYVNPTASRCPIWATRLCRRHGGNWRRLPGRSLSRFVSVLTGILMPGETGEHFHGFTWLPGRVLENACLHFQLWTEEWNILPAPYVAADSQSRLQRGRLYYHRLSGSQNSVVGGDAGAYATRLLLRMLQPARH